MATKAPDFTLTNDKGESVSLSDFRGKRVLIFFYPKAGTSGCTAQACGFRDAFPKIDAAGATVIGISPDKPAALAKWRAKENLPFVLLSDPDHKIAEAFGVWGEKSMYGRKFMGIIRSHFIIDEQGNIAESQIKVSPQDSVTRGVKALHADA
jgi:peroxiredoxin Q/BCP